MIVKEFYRTREDGVNLYRTFSDKGFLIKKGETDEVYDIAIDTENSEFEYCEICEETIASDLV
ncbi:MAG: hypothetical protein J6Q78_05690 [Clostridia bacterium]|nr:hypothetical protein [Clostridia bacterium]